MALWETDGIVGKFTIIGLKRNPFSLHIMMNNIQMHVRVYVTYVNFKSTFCTSIMTLSDRQAAMVIRIEYVLIAFIFLCGGILLLDDRPALILSALDRGISFPWGLLASSYSSHARYCISDS